MNAATIHAALDEAASAASEAYKQGCDSQCRINESNMME